MTVRGESGCLWTLVLLFILLVFALFASGHVFLKGLADGKRSQYELVLRCILILTSVRAGASLN